MTSQTRVRHRHRSPTMEDVSDANTLKNSKAGGSYASERTSERVCFETLSNNTTPWISSLLSG